MKIKQSVEMDIAPFIKDLSAIMTNVAYRVVRTTALKEHIVTGKIISVFHVMVLAL